MLSAHTLQMIPRARSAKTCIFPTKIFILLVLGFVYILIGGAIFEVLEADHEKAATQEYFERLNSTLGNVTLGFSSDQASAVVALIRELDDLRPETGTIDRKDWTLAGGMYYAMTVVTTIGYGWISCRTQLGQIVTVVYALFGIPLIFYLFAYVGRKLIEAAAQRVSKFWTGSSPKLPSQQSTWLPLFAAFVVSIILLCLMATGYHLTQDDWDFFEGFYFAFITTTTIGFGDYVPDFDHRGVFVVLQILAVFIMLSLYSYFLSLSVRGLNNIHDRVTAFMLRRMDIKGNRHVGPLEVVYYCLRQASSRRARHQADVLKRIFASSDLDDQEVILQEWANFALNHNVCRRPARQYTVYSIVGGPGSGKSTLCRLLAKEFNLYILDVDELILSELATLHRPDGGTPRAQAMHAVLQAGGTIPNEVLIELLNESMHKIPRQSMIILDGFPLNKRLCELFITHVTPISRVFFLECSDKTLRGRFRFELSASTGVRRLINSVSSHTPDRQHSAPGQLQRSSSILTDLNETGVTVQVEEDAPSKQLRRQRSMTVLDALIRSSSPPSSTRSSPGLRVLSKFLSEPRAGPVKSPRGSIDLETIDADETKGMVTGGDFDDAFDELLDQFLIYKQALLDYIADFTHIVDAEGSEDDTFSLLKAAFMSRAASNVHAASKRHSKSDVTFQHVLQEHEAAAADKPDSRLATLASMKSVNGSPSS